MGTGLGPKYILYSYMEPLGGLGFTVYGLGALLGISKQGAPRV